MGIRSTLISDSYDINWPEWFRDRYEGWLNTPLNGILASIREIKRYREGDRFYCDVQQVLVENRWPDITFNLVWLNEDKTLNVVRIGPDNIEHLEKIYFSIPDELW